MIRQPRNSETKSDDQEDLSGFLVPLHGDSGPGRRHRRRRAALRIHVGVPVGEGHRGAARIRGDGGAPDRSRNPNLHHIVFTKLGKTESQN